MERLISSSDNSRVNVFNDLKSSAQRLSAPSIIAYHGWGFGADCWQEWRQRMTQQGYRAQVFDRGYFGQPVTPEFAPSDFPKIIWAHSYGLHLCPVEQLQQANGVVLFSSFCDFHPAGLQRRRSEQMLHQMIDRFVQEPQLVLNRFKTKAYHPVSWSEEHQKHQNLSAALNTDLLLHDLQALNGCSLDLDLLRSLPRIWLLHGAADRIVPVAKSAELAAALPHNSQFFEIAAAGHALPFTHLQVCEPILDAVLQTFLPSE